jgi:hypothetical protein
MLKNSYFNHFIKFFPSFKKNVVGFVLLHICYAAGFGNLIVKIPDLIVVIYLCT